MSTQRLTPWREAEASRSFSRTQQERRHGERRRRSSAEKWASLFGGAALAAFGISRRSLPGVAMAAAGGFLVYRGVRAGHFLRPVQVEAAFTINQPVERVWQFWRNLENLPRFMTHLDSVQSTSARYSYWTAHSPLGKFSWHAEITDERENQYLVWRSLPGSEVDNRGSVEFRPAPANRGTEIRVSLEYRPPVGKVSGVVESLFASTLEQRVREDVRHVKQLLEAGEIPSVEGQPHGRRSVLVQAGQRAWQAEEKQYSSMPRTA